MIKRKSALSSDRNKQLPKVQQTIFMEDDEKETTFDIDAAFSDISRGRASLSMNSAILIFVESTFPPTLRFA